MFWSKKAVPANDCNELAEECRAVAEELYRSGVYHCAEAVLESIRRKFAPEMPSAVVGTVSGFGGGSASGCICGAVSGGTVAIGMVLQDKKKTTSFTKELHVWFKQKYGVTCCKVIRAENPKSICPVLTGEVAGKIAEMLQKN